MEADFGYGKNTEVLEHQISNIVIWNSIIKNNFIQNPSQDFRVSRTRLRTLIRAETQLGLYRLWLLKLSVLNEIRDGSKICQMLQFTCCVSIDVQAEGESDYNRPYTELKTHLEELKRFST